MRVRLYGHPFDIDESYLSADPGRVRRQVAEYAAGDRRQFDLGVTFPDDFRGEVMRAMARVPYGETRTYGELAAEIESSAVAVGGACGRNPVPVVVPCHRIVAAGSLGGYSAAGGVEAKRALLDAEAGQTGLCAWQD